MADVKEEIGKLRTQLLDMGKNNNLANYQPRDDRSVRIVDSSPNEVFDRLVMEGEGLRIVSNKTLKDISDSLKSNSPQTDIDRRLDRLVRIYYESYEDLGYTTVYAAMGFMNWRMDGKNSKAPIVLIPTELKRDQSGNVRIYWNGDDVRVSPTFVEKLRELKMSTPLPETVDDARSLSDILNALKETADERTGFKISGGIVIDTFDFSKSAMYNDIDPSQWSDIPPLAEMILDPSAHAADASEGRYIPSCTYSILDGDSSQMNVVMDVLDGRSVVVEGPPGTGKSQTIANVITECIGNGKTVLFVSEKMAALNVVKRRLDNAGLSSYVLELHSGNVNRKNFLKEMERSMIRDESFEAVSEAECSRLERVRRDLDAYNEAISTPVGNRELSPYQLIGMREAAAGNIKRRKRNAVRVEIDRPSAIDSDDWDTYTGMLRSAMDVLPQVIPIKKNFWKDCDVRNLTPDREHAFRDSLVNVSRRLDDLQTASKEICKALDIAMPQTIGEMADVSDICGNILNFGSIGLRDAMDGETAAYAESSEEIIKAVEEVQMLRSSILEKYEKTIFDVDPGILTKDHEKAKKKFLGMNKAYKDLKKTLEAHVRKDHTINDDDLGKDAAIIGEYRAGSDSLGSMKNMFGDKWSGERSDAAELRGYRDWMLMVKRNVSGGKFTDATALMISRGENGPFADKFREMGNYTEDMKRSLDTLFGIICMSPESKFRSNIRDMRPAAMKKWLKDMNANMDALRSWGAYCDLMERFDGTPLRDIAKKMSSEDIHPADLIDTFAAAYSSAMIAEAVNSRVKLNGFSHEIQDVLVKDLDELDRTVLEQNCRRLRKRMTEISKEAMLREDAGIRILKGEFNRGTGQMPVRKIMNLAGTAVQSVKPCFMMSPMSVAQYLSNKNIRFDVVIFDEASQVLPADSLGALMRGSQAVVMGDSKQLPPTVFFERKEEGTADVATAKDMESLLNLCRASLPVRVLSWHYRSRHDSLMALSNRLFYDDRLMVCPSPSSAPDDMGLKLRYVRTAVYDRGATASNPKEAKMIARAVWHHYIETPEKSLGIACFNINQQKAITDEVEKMFKRHPDARANMMKHVTEPFIIRNLENIQGDERDVMFISIGYGYDSDGKLSKSYGSLNRAGGERRLNVLMTRARESCIIFSNFKAMDMGMRDGVPDGVSALQAYLEYAEQGYTSKLNTRSVKDDLADAVGGFLASKGIRTAMNVGTSGFRIDIAVCSPNDPSSYVLGICLDGKAYQSMKYTRDRDRTSAALLRQMGWNTYRLWSMDWYSDPEGSKKRLWNRVSSALAKTGKKETDPAIFNMVSEIVEEDSPLHRDALIMKIKTSKKMQTVPSKMRTDIDDAVATGISIGRFGEENGYLTVTDRTIVPRKRSPDERWKPEWVHPQEYIKALQGSISAELSDDSVITAALACLGLPNHKAFREEIEKYFGIDE